MGILKRENRTMQTLENLHEKPAMRKNHGAKRKRYRRRGSIFIAKVSELSRDLQNFYLESTHDHNFV